VSGTRDAWTKTVSAAWREEYWRSNQGRHPTHTRAAHWKHGARSARLQADYRKWKRRQEAKETAEILNHLMEARKDVPPIFYAIMRQPYVPRVRVRYQGPGIYRGGPPSIGKMTQPSGSHYGKVLIR
jgi:hypothetical protein